MLVRVLGSIEARSSPQCAWTSPPPQQRVMLALLTAQLGRPCRLDQVVDALWDDEVPANARRLVQGLASRLRRVLEPTDRTGSRLRSVPGGWQLDLDADAVDAERFERLVDAARHRVEHGDDHTARAQLGEALGMWRGRPFGEVADRPCVVADTMRLEEQWLDARELLAALRVRAGEHAAVAAELQELVRDHPLRERLWGLLMRALYQSGRQADALAAYQQLRERLVEELGTDPGVDLQQLHEAILRQDLPGPTGRVRSPAHEVQAEARPLPPWPCRRDLPLTGRDEELAALHAALARARRGPGQVVLVSGEAGIGKTRLVAELADTAHTAGMDVLVGRCTEDAGVPYEPFVEALRHDVDAAPDELLAARFGGHAGELARLHPTLAERTGERTAPTSASAELDQRRLFDALAGWLATASAHTPLVLIIEDIHEATRPTLLALRHLARAAPNSRLLMLGTYRDTADELSTELVTTLAALAHQPETTHIALTGLGSDAVAELVAAGLDSASPDAALAGELHAVTAGNALFVQELLASLQPSDTGGPVAAVRQVDLPWSLRQLLADRLNRMARPTVRFLEQAAVAGEVFCFDVVADAAPVPEAAALDALDEAIDARLITGTDARTERYSFSHAIMRRALLDALSPSRRARLHAHLAATLEQHHADNLDAIASELAHHHATAGAAGEPAKALRFSRTAGDAAMGQLAYDEAATHYTRALGLLDVAHAGEDSRSQRCDLLIALGEAQQRAGPGVHRETLLEALRLATDLGDPDRIARAAWASNRGFWSTAPGTDEERVADLERASEVVGADAAGPRATVLALLAGHLVFGGDRARCHRLSDEALALARDSGDEVVLARVLAQRQFTIAEPATLGERLSNTAELCALADRVDEPGLRVFSRWWRTVAAFEAGDRPEVDARVDEAWRLADELGEPFMQCATLMVAANRELAWGDLDEAPALMERYRALGHEADATDIDATYWAQQVLLHRDRGGLADVAPHIEAVRPRFEPLPAWRAFRALVRWEIGDEQEALAILDRFGARGFDELPADMFWLHGMCALAQVAAAARRAAAAEALLEGLTPHAEHLVADPILFMGSVCHHLGVLATALEDWARAETYLDRAARTHEQLRASRWHNRTRLARARLLLARDRPEDQSRIGPLLDATATSARQVGQPALARACAQLHGASAPLEASTR